MLWHPTWRYAPPSTSACVKALHGASPYEMHVSAESGGVGHQRQTSAACSASGMRSGTLDIESVPPNSVSGMVCAPGPAPAP